MSETLSWDTLGRFADALSVVTAFASWYAAIRIWRIGARLAFNVRADAVLDRIEGLAGWIDEALTAGSFDANQMRHRIIQCSAEIKSVKAGIDGDARTAARQLEKLREKYSELEQEGALSQEESSKYYWMALNAIRSFTIYARASVSDRRLGGASQ